MQSRTLLFQPITPQDEAQLQALPCTGQCQLYLLHSQLVQPCERITLEQQIYYLQRTDLQIRGLFIVEMDHKTSKSRSFLKTSLDLKIQIFKQQSLVAQNYSPNWLRLLSTKQPAKALTFCSKNQAHMQQFVDRLARIPVIQLGFDKKHHYEPIRRLGRGSHAHVYESQDLLLNRKVALRCFRLHKVIKNGKFKNSFIEEVSLLQLLSSSPQPFFSKLQAIFQSQKSLYMVMELLPRNLKGHILKFGFPLFATCKKLMLNLAKALAALHRLDIMHRDIKLENIMLREDTSQTTTPVIVDFGIARRGVAPAQSPPCGTPGYIAPELFSGRTYGSKCDLFSLGVVYHYLLLGHFLFEGNSARAISHENKRCLIDYEFRRHPAITPEIRSLLVGMLRKDPESRLSAQEVVSHVFFQELA